MAVALKKSQEAGTLLDAYAVPSGEAGWAKNVRGRAAAHLLETGTPTRRDEYWKFTDPATLTCQPALPAMPFETDEAPLFGRVDRVNLVFVDGIFAPHLSDPLELAGVEIQPLSAALATDIHWTRELFGSLEAQGQVPVARPMAALNTARAQQGFAIRVHGKPEKPLSIVYLHDFEQTDAMIRHVVRVEAGADFTLLENGPGAARLNTVMEVDIADAAGFHHVRAQGRDHERRAVTGIFARLGRESAFKSFTLTMNGRLTRNECFVEFVGDDAIAHLAGACIGEGDFRHDDTIFVAHGAVNCESRQVFKKVLRSGAQGIFQGKILVRPGAQKTDGYQISQGLLLDDDSQFLAKPELEIYADDVACSHGSTCGSVDETALFYLRSRGMARREAQELLVLAFMDEAIAEIDDPILADEIRDRLAAWLARRRG